MQPLRRMGQLRPSLPQAQRRRPWHRSQRLQLAPARRQWHVPRLWLPPEGPLRRGLPAPLYRDLRAALLFPAKLPFRGRRELRPRLQALHAHPVCLSALCRGRLAPRCPPQRRGQSAHQERQLLKRDRLAHRFQLVSGLLSRQERSHVRQAHYRPDRSARRALSRHAPPGRLARRLRPSLVQLVPLLRRPLPRPLLHPRPRLHRAAQRPLPGLLHRQLQPPRRHPLHARLRARVRRPRAGRRVCRSSLATHRPRPSRRCRPRTPWLARSMRSSEARPSCITRASCT